MNAVVKPIESAPEKPSCSSSAAGGAASTTSTDKTPVTHQIDYAGDGNTYVNDAGDLVRGEPGMFG